MRVGVDTGGTFTDVVDESGQHVKVLSTRADPAEAVRAGLDAVAEVDELAHGTTVATNTLLERRGASRRAAHERRASRTSSRSPGRTVRRCTTSGPTGRSHWCARSLRLTVPGRIAADGTELVALDLSQLPSIPAEVETIAVCFLHADRWPAHERAAVAELARRGLDAVASHEISPEHREYERLVTTVVNAYVRPSCRTYLSRLAGFAPTVLVMTSAGGLVPLARAADRPATLLLSGPAAGVRAAASVAGRERLAERSELRHGRHLDRRVLDHRRRSRTRRRPVRSPVSRCVCRALDIHTIGAGGGSIARIDAGGALRVGPRSAGADPGPACYGRGGTEPTVTDADLALGHIAPGSELPGLGVARRRRCAGGARARGCHRGRRRGGRRCGDGPGSAQSDRRARCCSPGARARRVRRGRPDARLRAREISSGSALSSFPRGGRAVRGGAARHLCNTTWCAPPSRAQKWMRRSTNSSEAAAAFAGSVDIEIVTTVDCRYPGQSHEITVPTVADFHAEHERRNGYARPMLTWRSWRCERQRGWRHRSTSRRCPRPIVPRCEGPSSCPRRTARSGCPTDGRASREQRARSSSRARRST